MVTLETWLRYGYTGDMVKTWFYSELLLYKGHGSIVECVNTVAHDYILTHYNTTKHYKVAFDITT